MRKIWAVWDSYECKPVGAYTYEDTALKAKADYIASLEDGDFFEDDVTIEVYELHE